MRARRRPGAAARRGAASVRGRRGAPVLRLETDAPVRALREAARVPRGRPVQPARKFTYRVVELEADDWRWLRDRIDFNPLLADAPGFVDYCPKCIGGRAFVLAIRND